MDSLNHNPVWPQRSLQVVGSSGEKDRSGKPRVFLYDTNQQLLKYLHRNLSGYFDLYSSDQPAELLQELAGTQKAACVVYAWESPEQSLGTLQEVRKLHPEVPVLLLCREPEVEHFSVLTGLTSGMLLKPFTAEDLYGEILRKTSTMQESAEVAARKSVLDETHSFVRASKAMHEVERQAALVAKSDIPVLILGESGTGKEILAIYLHKMSKRQTRTFMKINCAAMPAELLESELFGYEQGAFTGAVRSKPGKFETCDNGTIFLDEIGEMPAVLQAKLLQVLQDGTFSRLGSRSTMKTNVRVISATNIGMKEAIVNGTFREDLYYRLNGLTIRLPPLRDRMDELPTMIEYFIGKGTQRFGLEPLSISPRLQRAMKGYHWPGNLRELENLINRLLVLRDEAVVMSELQAGSVDRRSDAPSQAARRLGQGEPDASQILQALEQHRWNRRAAADSLQISYKTLLSKIRQFDLVRRQA